MKAFQFVPAGKDDYAGRSHSFKSVRARDLFYLIDATYAETGQIFPTTTADSTPIPIRSRRHQFEAISKAPLSLSFVVTTSTGSCKSLWFPVPPTERISRANRPDGVQNILPNVPEVQSKNERRPR